MATEVTIGLKDDEMVVLDRLATEMGMSREGVVRQGLRLYQLVNRRLEEGETFSFSGDAGRARAFAGPHSGSGLEA